MDSILSDFMMVVAPTRHYDIKMLGHVIHRSLSSCTAVTEHNTILNVIFKNKSQQVITGDQINIEKQNDSFILTNIAPRTNIFTRADSHLNQEMLASNLSQVAIMIAPEPHPDTLLVDGMLAAAEQLNIKAIIINNKIDLSSLPADLIYYTNLYPVVSISAKEKTNFDKLMEALEDETTLFLGQSGVGKSTLMNRLTGKNSQKTSTLTKMHGKHTTSASTMHSLNRETRIVDTPGVRHFLPYFKQKADIYSGFKEMSTYQGQCKFHNCMHLTEPSCAVISAMEAGQISSDRYASYQKIYEIYVAENRN